MLSLAFDETVREIMRDYLTAVNRLRHAQTRAESMHDVGTLRALADAESAAEDACAQALMQRGWQPPRVPAARTG